MANQLGLEELTDAQMEAHKGGIFDVKGSILNVLVSVKNHNSTALSNAESFLNTGLNLLGHSELYAKGDALLTSIYNGSQKAYDQAIQYVNLIFR